MDLLHPFSHHPVHATAAMPPLVPPTPAPIEVKPMSSTSILIGGTGAQAAPTSETLGQKVQADIKKFVSILDQVGIDAEKGLAFLCKYAVPVASLVSLIFPTVAPEAAGAVTALDLIQKTVLEIKAKSAALPGNLTPAQMLADEIQLVEPAVIQLLATEKITVNSAQVTNIVQAVVAILNTQPAVAA
jgi:hypothetical protein